MSISQRLFGSWHVSFGRLWVNDAGGDYVAEETRVVPKASLANRYGLVCWHDRSKKFRGSIDHYLPAKPVVLHPLVDPTTVIATPRGYRVSRPAEEHIGGFVRVLRFDETDPVGAYEMDIFANGTLISSLAYDVV